MKSPLRILHLEDHPHDAQFVALNLSALEVPCLITRAATREEFVEALTGQRFDLVLSDFQLPDFDGLSALKLCRQLTPELPFILVTGTMGEEPAIESMQRGATDYVLKDRLSRLCPAVRRAMQEVAEREARQRVEAQFVQSQKMEIIGQLAGSVAHDFNNFLSVILGYTERMLVSLEPGHRLRRDAEEIKHAGNRAAGLTRQLLAFSRKQAFQSVVLDLNEVVVGMENILRRLLDENIELTLRPNAKAGLVEADSGYVGQVLMNLVVNARDAMPHGGKLTIETRPVLVNGSTPGVPPGEYVMLMVGDTGVGMTGEIKAHIFEPFFTTKPKSQGTGLGLATCKNIVKQCGGYITVESEPERGATFRVYFPRVGQSSASEAAEDREGPPPRGTETLLLVEDEPSVRQLAGEALRALGYTVLTAHDGPEGLRAAREHQAGVIQMVITDVFTPRMGSRVLIESLRHASPEVKVLFTFGSPDDVIAQHGALAASMDFLPKPYTPDALAHKVRAMLDAK